MKATLLRILMLVGVAAIAWAVGYVIADAPILTAQSLVAGGVPLSNDTISSASSETDHDIATFRSMLAGAFQEIRPLARRRRIIGAIATAPLDVLPAGLQMILSMDGNEASEYTGPLFARWAELDPVQAAQKAAVSDDYPLGRALEAVMEVWVGAAPAAAEQWVRNLRGGEAALRSVEAFILAVAESDRQRDRRQVAEHHGLDDFHGLGATRLTDTKEHRGMVRERQEGGQGQVMRHAFAEPGIGGPLSVSVQVIRADFSISPRYVPGCLTPLDLSLVKPRTCVS